jgi:uncharacterized membrane protein (DUF4010 family)
MQQYILEGVTVAILSSLWLGLKRELHSFAWGLSREELRSATEFAILAFVVYPLLPADPVPVTVSGMALELELRVVWLMVVTVAGIGIVNYAIVQTYGGRGIAVTGFFGGLASSTAVVGTMLDHVSQRPAAASYAVAAILLADAAMALRNLLIAIAFTLERGILYEAVVPLGAVVAGSVAVAAYSADWRQSVDIDLESPFSLRKALGFGAIFLVVLIASTIGKAQFGTSGLYLTAVLSGLASSGAATTSAVLLYRGGVVGSDTATIAILLATAASILVKAGLTLASPDRGFAFREPRLAGRGECSDGRCDGVIDHRPIVVSVHAHGGAARGRFITFGAQNVLAWIVIVSCQPSTGFPETVRRNGSSTTTSLPRRAPTSTSSSGTATRRRSAPSVPTSTGTSCWTGRVTSGRCHWGTTIPRSSTPSRSSTWSIPRR